MEPLPPNADVVTAWRLPEADKPSLIQSISWEQITLQIGHRAGALSLVTLLLSFIPASGKDLPVELPNAYSIAVVAFFLAGLGSVASQAAWFIGSWREGNTREAKGTLAFNLLLALASFIAVFWLKRTVIEA